MSFKQNGGERERAESGERSPESGERSPGIGAAASARWTLHRRQIYNSERAKGLAAYQPCEPFHTSAIVWQYRALNDAAYQGAESRVSLSLFFCESPPIRGRHGRRK